MNKAKKIFLTSSGLAHGPSLPFPCVSRNMHIYSCGQQPSLWYYPKLCLFPSLIFSRFFNPFPLYFSSHGLAQATLL